MSTINTTINGVVEIDSAPAYDSPLTIAATGAVINSTYDSQAIYGTGTVVNSGLIVESGGDRNRDIGIDLLGGGFIANTNTVVSDALGVRVVGSSTITNSGLIQGGREAVAGQAAVLLTNFGTISGGNDGVALSGGGTVINDGLIAALDGIGIGGGSGTVLNTGSVGGGIALGDGGIVSNASSGIISGSGSYAAIYIGGGTGVLTNVGTITGFTGVQFYGGTVSQTVTDSGTIIGLGGVAVAFGTGDDLFRLQSDNARIQGEVAGGGGTDTLEFLAGSGTLTGVGADFVGFSQGTVDPGANWGIAGDVTLGAGIKLTISGSLNVAGTLENAGSIDPVSYRGLQIAAGGYLRNDATGIIVNNTSHGAFNPAVRGISGDVTIVNLGAIEDPAGDASVYLSGGGTVVNGSATDTSALIEGSIGIYEYGGHATITNFGSIVGTANGGAGVALFQSGVVTNGAAGSTSALVSGPAYGVVTVGGPSTVVNFATISSNYYGVRLRSGGTVVDSGLITGGRQAISFGQSNNNLVVLEEGFTIQGSIVAYGAGSTGNVLELSGNAGAPVAANYNTLGLSGFQTVAFAPGNGDYATLTITNSAVLPGTIAGFTGIHDAIDLTALSDAGNDAATSFDTLTNVLTVTGDNGSVSLQLDAEDYTGVAWAATNDGSNGTEVTPLCFCAGTAIATPGGEVAVERLKVGDLVLTLSGPARAIAWIGTGRVLATRSRRNAATPVIVRKGAIAPNVPHSDLHVTKGHSLFLDGVLVPVEFLVNHRSILWDDHAQEVTLYHIELETHDVLLANGVPAESYRDDGNRWLFQNANSGWDLPPKPPCAEVVTGGPIVDAIWRRLLDRTGPRAAQVLTGDSDMHLMVDGCRVNAMRRIGSAAIFTLPAGARSVRIASRAAAPAELGLVRDPRVLGVALRCIAVRAGSRFRIIDVADDRLVEGFHAYEPDGDRRWTDGDAVLPAAMFKGFRGGVELVLHVDGTTRYRADSRSERTAA